MTTAARKLRRRAPALLPRILLFFHLTNTAAGENLPRNPHKNFWGSGLSTRCVDSSAGGVFRKAAHLHEKIPRDSPVPVEYYTGGIHRFA